MRVFHNLRQDLAEFDVNEERGQFQDVGEGGLKVCLVEAPGDKLLEQTRVCFVRDGNSFLLRQEEGLAMTGRDKGGIEGMLGSETGGGGLDGRPGGKRGEGGGGGGGRER